SSYVQGILTLVQFPLFLLCWLLYRLRKKESTYILIKYLQLLLKTVISTIVPIKNPLLYTKRTKRTDNLHFYLIITYASKAAPIKPLKIACGRSGREINSGWN